MRILICDDDLLIVEKLQKYLKSYFSHLHLSCPEIVCFSDGESLLADLGDKDILFLDIEMPGLDGIYVGNELKKKDKDIIIFIITSYSEYLDEAHRQAASVPESEGRSGSVSFQTGEGAY